MHAWGSVVSSGVRLWCCKNGGVVFLYHKVSSTWFLSTHVLNLLRMSIPSTLGVYRSIFSLSSLVVLGGMQTIVKLLHGILYSSLLDLKVRVTRLFISLFLKSPPKPTASRFEYGSKEESIPMIVASFSVIAE